MQFQDIVVCANGQGDFTDRLSLALAVGTRFASFIRVLAFRPGLVSPATGVFVMGEDGAATIENEAASQQNLELDRRRRAFEELLGHPTGLGAAADEPSVSAAWNDVHSPLQDAFPSYARACGLIVAGGRTETGPVSTLDDESSRIALLASGRPTLFAGGRRTDDPLRRILIAWNDGAPAARTIGHALPLIAQADAVSLFVVEPDPQVATPCNQMLAHLRRHAPGTTVRATSSAVHTVGHMILEEARAMQASLIVMGGYQHSRNRELLLGGTTRHVLGQAACPVLMSL